MVHTTSDFLSSQYWTSVEIINTSVVFPFGEMSCLPETGKFVFQKLKITAFVFLSVSCPHPEELWLNTNLATFVPKWPSQALGLTLLYPIVRNCKPVPSHYPHSYPLFLASHKQTLWRPLTCPVEIHPLGEQILSVQLYVSLSRAGVIHATVAAASLQPCPMLATFRDYNTCSRLAAIWEWPKVMW